MRETLPSGVGERLRYRPGEQRSAWRELRDPHVVVVAAGELGTRHTTRRTPYGPKPKTFLRMSRRAEAENSDGHTSGSKFESRAPLAARRPLNRADKLALKSHIPPAFREVPQRIVVAAARAKRLRPGERIISRGPHRLLIEPQQHMDARPGILA